jgi:hypothetical protein
MEKDKTRLFETGQGVCSYTTDHRRLPFKNPKIYQDYSDEDPLICQRGALGLVETGIGAKTKRIDCQTGCNRGNLVVYFSRK